MRFRRAFVIVFAMALASGLSESYAADPLLRFSRGGTLELPAGQVFSHYRVAARFTIPAPALARLRSRGAYPELELTPRYGDDFVILTTTLALRRSRGLPEAAGLDRSGCGIGQLPPGETFRVEGVCDLVLAGNPLRKRITIAREGPLLHVFSVTYRRESEAKLAPLLSSLRFQKPWRAADETRPR